MATKTKKPPVDDARVRRLNELLMQGELADGGDPLLIARRLVRELDQLAVVPARDERPIRLDYDDDKHQYWLDGVPVPSVSTIVNETEPKEALPWWGMRVGMAHVVGLLNEMGWAEVAAANEYHEVLTGIPAPGREHFYDNDPKGRKPKTLVEKMASVKKRSTNHVKEEAGDRGTAIHAVLEALGNGVMPNAMDFPDQQRGWVAGVCSWWLDCEPEFLHQEVMVGSRTHRYAGRFDVECVFKAGPYAGERCLVDLKTSKDVYRSHLVQLTGYEIAYVEMGLGDVFDRKLVLQVSKDGRYQLYESRTRPQLFVAKVVQLREIALDKAAHPGVQ